MRMSGGEDPNHGGEWPKLPDREDLEGVPSEYNSCDCWLHRSKARTLWAVVLFCAGILGLALVMAVASCVGVP